MSTPRKSAAARANGAKSRGPKTAATRAISSQNALTHGLHSWNTLVLCNESQEEFDGFVARYTRMYAPANDAETEFVNEMVATRWRIRRLRSIETALIDTEVDRQRRKIALEFSRIDEGVRIALAFRALADESNALQLISRYESRLRRIFDRALANLQALQQARKAAETEKCERNPPSTQPTPPQIVPDAPTAANTIEARSPYRAPLPLSNRAR